MPQKKTRLTGSQTETLIKPYPVRLRYAVSGYGRNADSFRSIWLIRAEGFVSANGFTSDRLAGLFTPFLLAASICDAHNDHVNCSACGRKLSVFGWQRYHSTYGISSQRKRTAQKACIFPATNSSVRISRSRRTDPGCGIVFGGNVWESNPPRTLSRPTTVLKTAGHTSYPTASSSTRVFYHRKTVLYRSYGHLLYRLFK